jgi:N-methylhydantoinase A/oxoprolinase/acetone carboxylase beta subunit
VARIWDIGTDIGGTFTDIVGVDTVSHETRIAKVPSRPAAPVRAMLEALAALGLNASDVRRFVHGTTRITNALVEGKLPKVALIATAGFEDVLEIGRYRPTSASACRSGWTTPARCWRHCRKPKSSACWTGCDRRKCKAWRSACCTPTPTRRTRKC